MMDIRIYTKYLLYCFAKQESDIFQLYLFIKQGIFFPYLMVFP